MKAKRTYIELGIALAVLVFAFVLVLPRFRNAQVKARLVQKQSMLREVLDACIATEQRKFEEDLNEESANSGPADAFEKYGLEFVRGGKANRVSTQYFLSKKREMPFILLRLRIPGEGEASEILWIVYAPVDENGVDGWFHYTYPQESIGAHQEQLINTVSQKASDSNIDASNAGLNFARRFAFDVTNGLRSQGDVMVWRSEKGGRHSVP